MSPYDVVISGVGGHFPECENLTCFQKRLQNGDNLITLDNSRWVPGTFAVDAHTGKTTGLNHFDFPFFGMHRSVTNSSDPCARKIMERTFEAIVDAGLNPRELYGSNTCVFISAMNPEHESVFLDATHTKNPLGIVGASRSMLANRISFFFNFTGRSCAYGSSWLWGGCGLERAYASISSGECDAALVGGCSLAMHAEMSRMLASMDYLSTDGVCRPFDANGSGIVRSEAQVVFLIQRADLAKRAYAKIVGVTSGSIGPRAGNILTPSAKAVTAMVRELYEKSGVDPRQIQYVECHGSGYQPADVAELVGLGDAMCHGRQDPLLVGSVKGNVGHTEAACGLVAAAKVISIMETGVVPATLNHDNPHPEIDPLFDGRIKVVTEKSELKINGNSVFAVSDMSFGGEVGHTILQVGGKQKKIDENDSLSRLVPVSGRTSEDLSRILSDIQNSPFDPEYYALIHNVFRQQIKNHMFRGYTICPPPENFRPKISQGAEVKRPLWFVFSGMGSQWPGMGRDLLRIPAFRETIERCQSALDHTGLNLFKILTTSDPEYLDDILHCFLGISAVQIGLINLLRLMGIQPDGYVGHSLGEQSCAYIDDCLDEKQTILAAYARGRASKDTPLIDGMMAAIGMGYSEIVRILPPTIDVACRNSAESCTISGPKADVENFVKELTSQKIFARLVNVANTAYHSRYIQEAGPNLLQRLEKIIPDPKERTSRWVSSSVPQERLNTEAARYCSAEYMTNNLISAVLFEEAFRSIPENAIIVEIAPHGLLQAILRRSSPKGSINVSLTQRGAADGIGFFLKSIGDLYAEGVEMDLSKIYPPVEYPVSRGTPSLAPLISWVHDEDLFTITDSLVARTIETSAGINSDVPYEIVHGVKVCSAAHLLMLLWKAIADVHRLDLNQVRILFERIDFYDPIEIPSGGGLDVDIGVQLKTDGFEVNIGERPVLSGRAIIDPTDDVFNKVFSDIQRSVKDGTGQGSVQLHADEIYGDMTVRGHEYHPGLKRISRIDITDKEWNVHLQHEKNWETVLAASIQAVQLCAGEKEQLCLYPRSIRRLTVDPKKFSSSSLQEVQITMRPESNVLTAEGFYLEGLDMAPIPLSKQKAQVRVSAPHFVPLGKNTDMSEDKLWTVAAHLIGQEQPWLNNIAILELKSTSGKSGDINFNKADFENCASKFGLKIRHMSFQVNGVPPAAALSEASTGSLIVCGSDSASAANKLVEATGSMLLIKMSNGYTSPPAELLHMASLCRSGHWFLLRRRSAHQDPKIVHLSGMEMPQNSHIRPSEKGTVLVWQSDWKEGVKPIADRLGETLDGILYRLFFILDEKAPTFSLNQPIYHEQLSLGLRVNVYHGGSWGTVIENTVPEHVGFPQTFESHLLSAISTRRADGTEIHYWGMNENSLKQKKRTEVLLDYAGESTEGAVMGIAVSRCGNPIPDPVLRWPLPNKWTFEDGATVPVAYCQGYLALKVLCNVRSNETVLVLNAAGPEEQALIRIALQYKCRVIATVSNDHQATTLRRALSGTNAGFPIIKNGNKDTCITLRSFPFIDKLDVVITRKAADLSVGLLSMIAFKGRVVYLGSPTSAHKEFIGMRHFLTSTTIYGVSAGRVLSMGDRSKRIVAEAVREGLRNNGAVKPLERLVLPASSDQITWPEGTTTQRKMLRHVRQSTVHFTCDPRKTYLVAGGTLIQNMALITWLARRGASHVVVTEKDAHTHLQRRARFFPNTMVYLEENLTSALKKATSVGKLDVALLVVQGFSDEEAARHIHKFRNDSGTTLVVINDSAQIASSVTQACEDVFAKGVQTLLTAGAANKVVSTRLLDWMLRSGNAQQVTVRSTQEAVGGSASAIRLLEVLPDTINSLVAMSRSMSQSPRLVEMPTLGLSSRDAKEVYPFYAIAGFGGCASETLQPLAANLLIPLVSVQLPRRVTSVRSLARDIAEAICSHQPNGPYSVFGSDWSTVLAHQVSVELRKRGEVVKLFLLDAEPSTLVQDAVEMKSRSDADLLLIHHTLGIIPLSKLHQRLAGSPSWEDKLNVMLPLLGSNVQVRSAAANSLCFFRDWISAIALHQVEQCDVETHLLQSNAPVSSQYSKDAVTNICQLAQPSDKVMSSAELQSYINTNMGWPVLQSLSSRVAAVKV